MAAEHMAAMTAAEGTAGEGLLANLFAKALQERASDLYLTAGTAAWKKSCCPQRLRRRRS